MIVILYGFEGQQCCPSKFTRYLSKSYDFHLISGWINKIV